MSRYRVTYTDSVRLQVSVPARSSSEAKDRARQRFREHLYAALRLVSPDVIVVAFCKDGEFVVTDPDARPHAPGAQTSSLMKAASHV